MDSLMLLKSKGSTKPLLDGPQNGIQKNINLPFSIFENIYWKELGLLPVVWTAFFTPIFNLLQLSVLTGEVGVAKISRERQGQPMLEQDKMIDLLKMVLIILF